MEEKTKQNYNKETLYLKKRVIDIFRYLLTIEKQIL